MILIAAIVAAFVVIVLIAWALSTQFATARTRHVARLTRIATEPLDATEITSPAAEARPNHRGISAAECAAYAGMPPADYLWTLHSIDPDVVHGMDFASSAPIANGWDLANYFHQHLDGLSGAAAQGYLNRLAGYVGEQRVTDLLQSHGHLVEVATTANNPVWDLLVDGHAVNVKTYANVASLKADALEHPAVTFLVPEDAHGSAPDNVVHLPGFDHAAIKDAVDDSVITAHGDAASGLLEFHLPVLTLGFVAYRRYRAVQAGQPLRDAAEQGAIEFTFKSLGLLAGAKVGAVAGTAVAGPHGTVVGGAVGALAGGVGGSRLATYVNTRDFKKAERQLREALADLGADYAMGEGRQRLMSCIAEPASRAEARLAELGVSRDIEARRLRNRVWPGLRLITLVEAVHAGERDLDERRAARDQLVRTLTSTEDDDVRALGVMIATDPLLSETVSVDHDKVMRVQRATERARDERAKLVPHQRPASV